MYVVIRRWAGSGPLIAEMERRGGEVEALIRGAPGFVAYYAARSGTDGLGDGHDLRRPRRGGRVHAGGRASGCNRTSRGRSWAAREVIEGQTFLAFAR